MMSIVVHAEMKTAVSFQSILLAFSLMNAIKCGNVRLPAISSPAGGWGYITIILSPVSAPELDLTTHCQSLFCVFTATVYLL